MLCLSLNVTLSKGVQDAGVVWAQSTAQYSHQVFGKGVGAGMYENRGRRGVWNPKICVPKIAQTNSSFCKFHFFPTMKSGTRGGGGGWHKASVSDCLPLAAPIGLSPLLILTLCGPECVLVVSTEPLDDLSCLTTPGSAVPETGCCPCR